VSGHRRDPGPRRLVVFDGSATIGRRVARILALPAVVVLVLLGIVASEQIQGFRSSQATERSVRLTLAVQELVHQLQAERGVAAAVTGGNPSFRNELAPARSQVDAQRAAVARLADGDGDTEARLRTALQQLDGLPALRAAVDGATAARAATFDYYTQRIGALVSLDLGLDQVSDGEMRRASSALRALMDLSEATAQERAFLNGVFSAGGFGKGEFIQFAAMRTARDAALASFRRLATPSESAASDYVFGTGAARTSAYFEQVALSAADGRHVLVNPQSWWSGQTTVLDDVLQLQEHLGSKIQLRAHDLQTGSAQRIAGLVVLVLLCVGGSIMLAVLASLSITRPLASLATEADAVASQRLPAAMRRVLTHPDEEHHTPPQPVKVPSRATREISSVASALDRLQSAAYGLATEQALQRQRVVTSLANLGRRNQNLIRRQLGFITRLEREEMDPAALSNLFELDHLATRMRRNAASLLVLVGESGPRQWSSPIAMADVIRAAVSEVEEYRRVALRRVDDVLVAGSAVGSVVHLLSELIENALTFSPPDSEAEVQGRLFGDSYLIAITDQGVGMSGEDLRVANARLQGEGDFIAAPTRFLGHFVVGELARTSGIDVQLVPSPVIGVTARITLPSALLSGRVAVESGPGPRSLQPRAAKAALDAVTGTGPIPVPAAPHLEPVPVRAGAHAAPPHLTAVTTAGQGLAGSGDGAGDGLRGPDSNGIPVIDLTGTEPAAPGVRTIDLTAAEAAGHAMARDGDGEPALDPAAALLAVPPIPPAPVPPAPVPPAPVPAGPIPPAPAVPAAEAGPPPGQPGSFDPVPWSPWDGAPGESAWDRWSQEADAGPGPARPGFPERPLVSSGVTAGAAAGRNGRRSGGGVPGDDADAARTRNGLRKRVPRRERPAPPPPEPARRAPAPGGDDGRPGPVGGSPAEIRARLTSLRSGMQRGQGTPADTAASTPATPSWPARPTPAPEDLP
jgi:hypothetical protein